MKRNTYHLSAALALLLGLAACTQDELSSPSGGVEGAAMTFTATGLNPAATAAAGTRAPVDGDWEGVQSVAVLIGGKVKAYDVTPTTADHTSATLTSTDPHYWADHNDRRVTAWWPYTAGETAMPVVKVRQDQSTQDGYEGSDFIAAEEQAVSYANPTLRFTHRTARVTVALTNRPEESMNVRLTGLSIENENPAVIAPYNKGGDTWSALVAPQTVAAGTAFITCTFTSGKSFVYRMQKAAEWKAGEEYTYTVSLAAAEDPGYTIESDGSYTVNNEKGLKNIASLVNGGETDINITLDTDLTLTGEWTPIGTYDNPYTGTFNGKDKTITGLTVNQEGTNYVGLIGYLGSGGKVKNVVLEGVQITSDNSSGYAGGVAGDSWGTIENCSVSGSVSGTTFAGGVVGSQRGGSITGCNSSATVKGVIFAGGIAGETNSGASLTGCYATGDVTVENDGTNNSHAGGVVGYNGGGTLTACYATGSVTGSGSGTIYVGGVTGSNILGTLTACYHAKRNINGPNGTTGGVVGRNFKDSMIGGGIITACYWGDNGQTQGIGEDQVGTGGTTQVTDGNWSGAKDAMNAALKNAGSAWSYTTGEDFLPTLEQGQQ